MNNNNSIYKWTKVHASCFSDFINKLNSADEKYFILRNFEGLPENNFSKDVDIIIEPGTFKKVLHILLASMKDAGFDHYYIMNYERAHCIYGFNTKYNFYIHVDLIEGYANKGYEIFSFNELYANTIVYGSFRVLKPSYDAVMLLLYKLVGVRELKIKYQNKIKDIYKTDRCEILEILSRVLSKKTCEFISECLDKEDFVTIIDNAREIGKSAKSIAAKKNIIKTFIGWNKFLFEKAYNIIMCPPKMRKMIVVEAPDGTGKTTFINALVEKISQAYVSDLNKSKVYHFRPELLPNLGAAGQKVGVMKQDKDFTNPHRAKPAGFVSSLIRMIYYWLDYIIGMPLILRKNAQFDKITIFDRYIYDFLVDPYRTRIKLPYCIRKVFTQLVIQPKIIFVLDTDASIIYSRKQELSEEEINRQLTEYRKLKDIRKRVYLLDASKRPQEIADDAIEIIIDTFTNKL